MTQKKKKKFFIFKVYAWGCSKYGQLGLGDVYESPYPRLITSLANENVITLSCGQFHTLALTEKGQVFAWGWGVHGQLGLGNIDDQRLPVCVNHLKDQVINNVYLYCVYFLPVFFKEK